MDTWSGVSPSLEAETPEARVRHGGKPACPFGIVVTLGWGLCRQRAGAGGDPEPASQGDLAGLASFEVLRPVAH